jgi:translation elongation factor EF-Tu-like GTPase
MLQGAPHVEAEVRFLTSAEGGRKDGFGPGPHGYRPTHDLGHLDGMLNDGRHMYPGLDWVPLGETVIAKITLLVPHYQYGHLYEGMPFKILEGSKIVGHGVVRTVLDPQMRKI